LSVDNNVERKMCSFCGKDGEKGMRFAGGLGAMICEDCVEHYHSVFHSPQKLKQAAKAPWDSISDTELLSYLPLISRTADQVAEFLVEWVGLARSRDISWAPIGKALGISRQAAWERFSSRIAVVRGAAVSVPTASQRSLGGSEAPTERASS
jgi:hypothetical protein